MSLSQRDPTWTLGMILWPWWWVKEFHRQAQDIHERLMREMDKRRKTEELLILEQRAHSELARNVRIIGETVIDSKRSFTVFARPAGWMHVDVRPPSERIDPIAYDRRTRDYSVLNLSVTMASLDGISELTRAQAAANLHCMIAKHTDELLDYLEADRFKACSKDGVEFQTLKDDHWAQIKRESARLTQVPQMTLKNIGGETTS